MFCISKPATANHPSRCERRGERALSEEGKAHSSSWAGSAFAFWQRGTAQPRESCSTSPAISGLKTSKESEAGSVLANITSCFRAGKQSQSRETGKPLCKIPTGLAAMKLGAGTGQGQSGASLGVLRGQREGSNFGASFRSS